MAGTRFRGKNKPLGVLRSSVSSGPITWTFDGNYYTGQYCTGDWWVVGPVTISSITPAPTGTDDGSMIDPRILYSGALKQAYTTNCNANYAFDTSLGAYPPFTTGPCSLVSTIHRASPYSDASGTYRCYLDYAKVLTVVSSPPLLGAFRPWYIGPTKQSTVFNSLQVRSDLLPRLTVPAGGRTPTLASISTRFVDKLWLDYATSWLGRFFHANDLNLTEGNNGTYMAYYIGRALGLLMLNPATIGDYTSLLYSIIQLGIDWYGVMQNGGSFAADGAHMLGRKMPILFAGKMLSDSSMQSLGAYTFQEDQQSFYVQASDVSLTHRCQQNGTSSGSNTSSRIYLGETLPSQANGYIWNKNEIEITGGTGIGQRRMISSYNEPATYFNVSPNWNVIPDATSTWRTIGYETTYGTTSDGTYVAQNPRLPQLSDPAWGIRHAQPASTTWDSPTFQSDYLNLNVPYWRLHALMAYALDLRTAWNHEALFDLLDWANSNTPVMPGSGSGANWETDMWDAYRVLYSPAPLVR